MAIENVTLIDGTETQPVRGAVLVFEEGRIRCAGAPPSCEAPAQARRVDGGGRWLIPGLIDTHVHVRFGSFPEVAELEERLRFMFGVTATRDAGTRDQLQANLRARASGADPSRPLPRLFVSGNVAHEEGASPEDYATRVRTLASLQVDGIKLKDVFEEADYRAIVREALAHGLVVWGHAWAEYPTRSLVPQALAAGLVGLSHLHAVTPLALDSATLVSAPSPAEDPEAWRVWRKSLWNRADEADLSAIARDLAAPGVWLDPILISEELFAAGGYQLPDPLVGLLELGFVRDRAQEIPFADWPDDVRSVLAAALSRMREFVRSFHEAGGVVVTGTDRMLIPGLNLHEEIHALVAAGLTPSAALAAATRDAALVIGAQDSLGTLEAGKVADFVVLEADPLADIENTLRAWRVAKGGRLYDPNVLFDVLVGTGAGTLTRSRTRLIGAGLAAAGVILAAVIALLRHRQGRATL